jgi:hypothetical protein
VRAHPGSIRPGRDLRGLLKMIIKGV